MAPLNLFQIDEASFKRTVQVRSNRSPISKSQIRATKSTRANVAPVSASKASGYSQQAKPLDSSSVSRKISSTTKPKTGTSESSMSDNKSPLASARNPPMKANPYADSSSASPAKNVKGISTINSKMGATYDVNTYTNQITPSTVSKNGSFRNTSQMTTNSIGQITNGSSSSVSSSSIKPKMANMGQNQEGIIYDPGNPQNQGRNHTGTRVKSGSSAYRSFFQEFKQSKQPVTGRFQTKTDEVRRNVKEEIKKTVNNKSFTVGMTPGTEQNQRSSEASSYVSSNRAKKTGHSQSYSSNQAPRGIGKNEENAQIKEKISAAVTLKKISESAGKSNKKGKEEMGIEQLSSARYSSTRHKQPSNHFIFFHCDLFLPLKLCCVPCYSHFFEYFREKSQAQYSQLRKRRQGQTKKTK